MISNDWLYRWKCFVSNKVSSQSASPSSEDQAKFMRRSANQRLGFLPPGPISNECLFIKVSSDQSPALPNNIEVKQGLQLNKDYRGVNRDVWQLFHRIYGGGPLVVREELDIYSTDISKIVSDSQNQNKSRKDAKSNIFATAKSSSNIL